MLGRLYCSSPQLFAHAFSGGTLNTVLGMLAGPSSSQMAATGRGGFVSPGGGPCWPMEGPL